MIISKFWTDMYNARTFINDPVRYKNPFSSKRNQIVFNLFRIKENCDRIILNEGAINSIIAGPDSVASFGKYISDEQLKMIIDKHPARIYVSLDTDAREKAEKLCNKLLSLSNSEIYLVELPDNKDASDLGREGYNYYIDTAKRYTNQSIYLIEKYISQLKSV
jgi:DNA-binding LacI/PurR family transcriptional regulator